MARSPRRAVAALPAASLALALLAAACGPAAVGERDVAPSAAAPSAAALAASPSPAPTGSPSMAPAASAAATASVVEPEPGVLPRSLTYAMLTWTVTGAVMTDQDPRSYAPGVAGPPTPQTSLIADLEIRNDDVHVTFVSTTARLVAALPDGTVVPGTELVRTSAPPMSTVAGRYAFEVPAGIGFDGLALRFEDPGREPSLDLPLSGPAPDVEAHDRQDLDLALDLALPGIDMGWTLDELVTGRDWPLPIGFKGGALVPGARAETGHRWVGITARVDVGRCDCAGGVLDQSASVRLLVDGLPYTAAAVETSRPILAASTFADVMLVFHVPAGATTGMLQVGPLDAPDQQASAGIPLEVLD